MPNLPDYQLINPNVQTITTGNVTIGQPCGLNASESGQLPAMLILTQPFTPNDRIYNASPQGGFYGQNGPNLNSRYRNTYLLGSGVP